ncbi:unnamed protein product, partial [Pocillopora meandrina]
RYLQQNLIIKIENLEHLQQLDSLDVSNNTILGLKTSMISQEDCRFQTADRGLSADRG